MLSLTLALYAYAHVLPVPSQHAETGHGSHVHPSEARGALGNYPARRDASGTSWQPDSTPMEGIHFTGGELDFMLHGFLNVGSIQAVEPRGASEAFTTNMLMFMGSRRTEKSSFGFRAMMSAEPVLGPEGYPLLLQTGETADGVTPLLDRQHPHDAVMELAVTYSRDVTSGGSIFFYFAPVGEPAIGPSVFMHRYSSEGNPLAPIAHHWMDATHIAYGVVTAGWVASSRVKLEASVFNGREPDHRRWNLEPFRLDSYAARVTVNPTPDWSIQASLARLSEPERLHAGLDTQRMTVSATYNRPLTRGNWQTTVIWGRNKRETGDGSVTTATTSTPTPFGPLPANVTPVHFHGNTPAGPGGGSTLVQNAVTAETGLRFLDAHSLYGRFEYAQKDELFEVTHPLHSTVFDVMKLDIGYGYDFLRTPTVSVGLGFNTSLFWLPAGLAEAYGFRPRAYSFFVRTRLGS